MAEEELLLLEHGIFELKSATIAY